MARFRPGWQMSLFVLLMLPLLLSLGSWQLRRGAEKEALEAGYLARSGDLPVAGSSLDSVDRDAMAFVRVRLQGRYQHGEYYLIDNQVRDGVVGYWVLHRFLSDDDRLWFVNRGFIAATKQRTMLPEVSSPAGGQQITAIIWPDTGLQPRFGDAPGIGPWPQLRQRIDVAALVAESPNSLPVELRLEAGQPGALLPAPSSFASGAARHRGYAVQWFALAAVLMMGFIVFGLRRSAADDADSV